MPMPSTEFLLYLVIVIFAVYVIMNYYKEPFNVSNSQEYRREPNYKTFDDDNRSIMSRRSSGSENAYDSYYRTKQHNNGFKCNNSQCIQYGRCVCGGDKTINIDVNNNRQEYTSVGSPGPVGNPLGGPIGGPPPIGGPGPVGGPGVPPPVPPIDPLRKFDYDSVNDEFTPPFRRSYYDDNNYRLVPGLFPTYTRGPPGRFRKVGTLIAEGVTANDKYKFLLLMGRQKYPSSDDYEYYASSADADQRLKFYIETRGKEIRDGDNVRLPELEGYIYCFREDQDLSPKYDPYLI